MKQILASAGLALVMSHSGVEGATLNIETTAPVIDIPQASAAFFRDMSAMTLVMSQAEGTSLDAPISGTLRVDLVADFDLADPLNTIDAALFSSDDDGAVLDGDLVSAGTEQDTLQLLFGNLSGSAAPIFGESALVELFFVAPPLGADPFAALTDDGVFDIAGSIQATTSSMPVAPIPLPASLPLMAGALSFAVVIFRRRQTA